MELEDLESNTRCSTVRTYKTRFVQCFSWRDVSVWASKGEQAILSNISGHVPKGELLAIMGPSGSGKSTLLSMLAKRPLPLKATSTGHLFMNGREAEEKVIRRCSQYVEQQDSLIGSLTVRETLRFADGLAEAGQHHDAVEERLENFGLLSQADNYVGTPVRKGLSGGEQKRVSVAASVMTEPGILFLDEPTSGLDSAAAFKVIVIASVHQPSTQMFDLFDRVHLMAKGKTLYFGPREKIRRHFFDVAPSLETYAQLEFTNTPAEQILHYASLEPGWRDRSNEIDAAFLRAKWEGDCVARLRLEEEITDVEYRSEMNPNLSAEIEAEKVDNATVLWLLIHRSFLKSYRDVTAYGIRVAMYIGLALLMGTMWLRLAPVQDNIQAFINDIFFGGAFMSFMAVAYIPAFLEDRATYVKERANGLYGPTTFLICNFLIGIPYLLLTTVLFSLISYWLSNFQPTPTAFFSSIMWLFFDLLAAESLVVLISSAVPIFVVALAGTAFANGVWMCAGGFLVPVQTLAAFWRYLFHYIDYQSYVFQGMMVNEFANRNYTCAISSDRACECLYDTELSELCLLPGTAVLHQFGISVNSSGSCVGALIGIIFGLRVLCWLTLCLKRS